MPIRKEMKSLYPPDWPDISRRIRERAGNRCEQCGAPNVQVIARGTDGTYMLMDGQVFDAETGAAKGWARGSEYPLARFVRIVLTTAHLNHDPRDNSDGNLRSLCQLHHLAYDRVEHGKTRRARRAVADLFGN
jgi:hypothetical protein